MYQNLNIEAIDFHDEPAADINLDNVPELCKHAELITAKTDCKRFALKINDGFNLMDKFAMDTEACLYMNMIKLEENSAKLPKEAVKIASSNMKEACDEFGIEPTDFVASRYDSEVTSNFYNLADAEREVIASIEDGNIPEGLSSDMTDLFGVKNYIDLESPESVKKAMMEFPFNKKDMTVENRRNTAEILAKTAEGLKIKVASELKPYLKEFPKTASSIRASVVIRKTLTLDQEAKNYYQQLSEKLGEWSREKIAEAMTAIDKKAGVDKTYDVHVEDPYCSVFHKKASEKKVELGGEYVNIKKLQNADFDKLSSVFETQYARDIISDPERALDGASRETKRLILEQISA